MGTTAIKTYVERWRDGQIKHAFYKLYWKTSCHLNSLKTQIFLLTGNAISKKISLQYNCVNA